MYFTVFLLLCVCVFCVRISEENMDYSCIVLFSLTGFSMSKKQGTNLELNYLNESDGIKIQTLQLIYKDNKFKMEYVQSMTWV